MKASTQTTATTLIYPETADKWASKKQSSAQASGQYTIEYSRKLNNNGTTLCNTYDRINWNIVRSSKFTLLHNYVTKLIANFDLLTHALLNGSLDVVLLIDSVYNLSDIISCPKKTTL